MLKKVLLTVIVFSLSVLTVFADRVPSSSKSIKHYGIGLLKFDEDFNVYESPNENTKIIKRFILPIGQNKTAIIQDNKKSANPFIVSVPGKKLFFATIYEYPENDWVQIYYNQYGKETGWVKMPQKENFLTWKEFVFKYGKKNGIVLMRDVPINQYKLYAKDSEEAQIVDEFTYPEYVALRMIRGNWALVTVVDSGSIYKTGWFKWRTDDGKLRVFPKM